ncbi:MAG: hypothetical protein E7018_02635 [Alphaproteobacteria bacterium]|nr:hypothetical protein [Alphaproteobacteria bacterium]
MSYGINGVYYCEQDPAAPRKKYSSVEKDEDYTPYKYDKKIEQFIDREMAILCRDYSILPGSVVHLAVSNWGVEITVNGCNLPYREDDFDDSLPMLPLNHNKFGNLKNFCKTKGFTQKTRIFYAENYLLGVNLQMEPVLGDDAFLDASGVRDAFNAIAEGKGWQTKISKVEFSEVCFANVKFKAWTAVMTDCQNVDHQMVCLISNGMIVPDYEGEIVPVILKQGILTERDARFRVHWLANEVSYLERLR